jgi:hypothetical protein
LNFVIVELAGAVAIRDPITLHDARLGCLLAIERTKQGFIVFVEQIVPDLLFDIVAIGRRRIAGRPELADARISNSLNKQSCSPLSKSS